MSDFFRIPADPSLVPMTSGELARLAHQAEDADDDVLMVQIQSELERRERVYPGMGWTDRFREAYIRLHRPELRRR
jgi:hypothetical protein